MKKLNYLFLALAGLIGVAQAQADQTFAPYAVDFNTSISTTNHDFKVASGWGHIVSYYTDEYYDDYYAEYTYKATSGIDGSGALLCGAQTNLGDGWGADGTTTDLLVTPLIKGKSSIYVKKNKYSASIAFYKVTKSGATYKKGSQLSVTIPTITDSTWTKIDIPAQSGAYIGIYGNNVLLDNFAADTAQIVETKALKLGANPNKVPSSSSLYCDSLNNFVAAFAVKVTNNGDVAFKPGDENYAIQLYNYSNKNKVLATVPISKPLAPGETITDTVSVTLNYNDTLSTSTYNPKYFRIDLREMIGKTTTYGGWFEPTPYLPELYVRDASSMIESGKSIAFGMVTKPATQWVTLKNTGAAPLKISEFVVPEGFSVNLTAPLTIEAGATDTLFITLGTDKQGVLGGNLVIKNNAADFTLVVSGTVLDTTKQFITFEDRKMPDNWYIEPAADGYIWWKFTDFTNGSNNFAYNGTVSYPTKLESPLLKVGEGEKLSIDVARIGQSNTSGLLKVYYSTDRKDWKLVKTIKGADLSGYYVQSPSSATGTQKFTSVIIDSIPAGNVYVAFEAGYLAIDNLYGFKEVAVDHDLIITKTDIPSKTSVNAENTAKATIQNILTNKQETDVTATLFVGGEAVATVANDTVAGGASKEFEFKYTLTEAGTYPAYVEFKTADGYTVTSDVDTVVVDPESATKEVVVGTTPKLPTSTSGVTPVNPYYKNSISESLYPAKELAAAGLKKGDKIASISYEGYAEKAGQSGMLKVYITNTPDSIFGGAKALSTSPTKLTADSLFTKVYDATYTFSEVGSKDNTVKLLNITLDSAFTYTGEGLRIKVSLAQDSYFRAYFLYDANTTTTTAKAYTFGAQSDGTAVNAFTSFSAKYRPVVTLGVTVTPSVVSGKVTDADGEAIAGATVVLTQVKEAAAGAPHKANEVKYSAVTAEDGTYSIQVLQPDATYTAVASAEGYKPATVTIDTKNGNVTENFVLEEDNVTGVTDVKTVTPRVGNVYTIDGRLVRANAETLGGLSQGIYIWNGKKVIVK